MDTLTQSFVTVYPRALGHNGTAALHYLQEGVDTKALWLILPQILPFVLPESAQSFWLRWVDLVRWRKFVIGAPTEESGQQRKFDACYANSGSPADVATFTADEEGDTAVYLSPATSEAFPRLANASSSEAPPDGARLRASDVTALNRLIEGDL